jgi:hypothetical protein
MVTKRGFIAAALGSFVRRFATHGALNVGGVR